MKNATNNSSKILLNFYCEKCHYGCSKRGDYNKHLVSKKHNATKCYKNATSNSHICNCGKEYKHTSSFYRHKKKCAYVDETKDEIKQEPTIEFLLKENLEIKKDNLEMKKMMIDLCKKIEPTNITNNNNNTNNFNIQIFLNEDCKYAMNLTDFIDSISRASIAISSGWFFQGDLGSPWSNQGD